MRQLTWILVGMLIFGTLAVPAQAAPAGAGQPARVGESFGGMYVVQPGDSLWRIANRYGISLDALRLHTLECAMLEIPAEVQWLSSRKKCRRDVGQLRCGIFCILDFQVRRGLSRSTTKIAKKIW